MSGPVQEAGQDKEEDVNKSHEPDMTHIYPGEWTPQEEIAFDDDPARLEISQKEKAEESVTKPQVAVDQNFLEEGEIAQDDSSIASSTRSEDQRGGSEERHVGLNGFHSLFCISIVQI